MVSQQSVELQLAKLGFNHHSWGRSEVGELSNILLDGEEILEVINGTYEAGFALLLATNIRVILVDKKPLNYLTVEDMRFDMISELDYSHRLFSAQISITAGNKSLKFRSYNQPKLRKLINHVQHLIAEHKKQQSNHQEGQNFSLEKINQQLQVYLLAQFHQSFRSDTSTAQGLQPELKQFLQEQNSPLAPSMTANTQPISSLPSSQELYEEGIKEVFFKRGSDMLKKVEAPFIANVGDVQTYLGQ